MKVTVNGQARDVAEDMTLLGLLALMNLRPDATVVEHNGSIVKPADFGGTALAEGDALELIRFVGGG